MSDIISCYDCKKDLKTEASTRRMRTGIDGKKHPICENCYKEIRLSMIKASKKFLKNAKLGI